MNTVSDAPSPSSRIARAFHLADDLLDHLDRMDRAGYFRTLNNEAKGLAVMALGIRCDKVRTALRALRATDTIGGAR